MSSRKCRYPGNIRLEGGSHEPDDGAMNIMELTASISGEPWGSQPGCASPTLTDFLNHLVDHIPQGVHQQLAPLAPELASSNCPDCEEKRLEALADLALRESLPSILRQRLPRESRTMALMDAEVLAASVWPQRGNGQPEPHRAAVKAADLLLRATDLPMALARMSEATLEGEEATAEAITAHVRAALAACRHREEESP